MKHKKHHARICDDSKATIAVTRLPWFEAGDALNRAQRRMFAKLNRRTAAAAKGQNRTEGAR